MLVCRNQHGVAYYASPRLESLGVRHAFSTRRGGISPAPFDSLNLGNPSGCPQQDDYDRIWANYRKLLATIGCPGDPPLRVHQVHSNAVARVQTNAPFDVNAKADAIVSRDPRRPISIRTADCLPLLIASPDGKAVAAVHAGWRGIVSGVIFAAVTQLLGIHPEISASDLIAAIGPCIGPKAFEVGPEVVLEFQRIFGTSPPLQLRAGGKAMVDLPAAAGLQLLASGLSDDHIDISDRCTVTHAEEFFSHRRDNGVTGRMAAVILPN